jgi:hypothetical protein
MKILKSGIKYLKLTSKVFNPEMVPENYGDDDIDEVKYYNVG